MSKLRKIAFYSMIPVVIICLIEGGIYYSSYHFDTLAKILCTLENTIKIFLAHPSISSYYAFRAINQNTSKIAVFITYLYAFIVFIAPILTTTAVVAGFSAYILDFWHSIKISFKPKMFVVGDGNMADNIALKYSNKYYVHFLMPDGTKNEDRLPLLRKAIKAYTVDYSSMQTVCKDSKIEKAECVVLIFSNWLESYKTITGIIDYLIKETSKEPTPVFLIDAPTAFKDVFDKMYDGLCKQKGKPKSVLTPTFINVDEMNSKIFFNSSKLTVQPNGYHHIIFAGLGTYGRAILKGLFKYMIENNLSGTIEIIDRHVDYHLNDLMLSTESLRAMDMFEVAQVEELAEYSCEAKCGNSKIRLNFYQGTIGEIKYTTIVDAAISRQPVTEYFLCVENVSTSLESFRLMEGYSNAMKDTKIFFRVGENLMHVFEALKISYPRLECLPDGLPDVDIFEEIKDNDEA